MGSLTASPNAQAPSTRPLPPSLPAQAPDGSASETDVRSLRWTAPAKRTKCRHALRGLPQSWSYVSRAEALGHEPVEMGLAIGGIAAGWADRSTQGHRRPAAGPAEHQRADECGCQSVPFSIGHRHQSRSASDPGECRGPRRAPLARISSGGRRPAGALQRRRCSLPARVAVLVPFLLGVAPLEAAIAGSGTSGGEAMYGAVVSAP